MILTPGLFIVPIRKAIAAIRAVIAVAMAMVLVVDQPMNILAHSPVRALEAGIETHAGVNEVKNAHGHSHADPDDGKAKGGPERNEGHLGHNAADHAHESGTLACLSPPPPLKPTQRKTIGSDWAELPERLWLPERPPRHA